jgi:hypothetical protein
MKTFYLSLGVAILALGSYAEAASLVGNEQIDISFDGTCAGMHLNINQSLGRVTGKDTGCTGLQHLIGTVGSLSNIGAGISVMSQGTLYVIDDDPKKWTSYSSDGTVIQRGTYSIGKPE